MRKRTILLTILLAVIPCSAAVITVAPDGGGDEATIQDAVDIAGTGDEIVLAIGTYTGDGNRDIDFGGKSITVRSENGPENCIIDCQGTEAEPHRGFNFFNGENIDSILSGITITNGYADKGGGVYCGENSSPTIDNCIISGNSNTSFLGGSGIYCIDNSPDINNCTISDNIDLHFEHFGAAIVCETSTASFTNCVISDNIYFGIYCRYNCGIQIKNCIISRNEGYGIYCWSPTVIEDTTVSQNAATGIYCRYNTKIRNCTVSGNERGIHCSDNTVIKNCIIEENTGGGVIIGGNDSKIFNSIIAQNTGYEGAGIHCYWSLNTIVAHCTISDNSSIKTGGGIHCGGSIMYMSDCILWGNTAPKGQEIYVGTESRFWPSSFRAWYNDVQGGQSGVYVEAEDSWLGWYDGNINLDPQFISSTDFHLQSNSPCIDKGTNQPYGINLPATDLDGNPRIINGIVDMGVYEFNHIPIADAGPDQTVYACIDGIAEVTLDGSGSFDADGDLLEYFWFNDANELIAEGVDPNVILPVGEHVIELIVNDGIEDSEPNEVVITVIEPIEADLHIAPRVINRSSRGISVVAIITMPEGIGKDDIDVDVVFTLFPGGIAAETQLVREIDDIVKVFALFNKSELMDAVAASGEVELTTVGKLKSGQCVYGADSVRIIQPRQRLQWQQRDGRKKMNTEEF